MLKDFNQFIWEAKGFSSTVAEYSELSRSIINRQIWKYLNMNFKERFKTYATTIEIKDAFSEVSQEAAREFPIDNISILFRIVPVKQENFGPYAAHYERNYDKVKLLKGEGEKVNIKILCKLYISTDLNGHIDTSLLNEYLRDILNHEFTHAFNDYKNPNFLKKYRLGVLPDYAIDSYRFIQKSTYLKTFLRLLYVLTDSEINAIAGERTEFKTLEEFNNYSGTYWARLGLEYNPEEYYEAIESELYDYTERDPKTKKLRKYWSGINQHFGRIFVDLYREVNKDDEMGIDPKILALEDSADLQKVLTHFEPYIKSKANELYRRLSKKITQQGRGEII